MTGREEEEARAPTARISGKAGEGGNLMAPPAGNNLQGHKPALQGDFGLRQDNILLNSCEELRVRLFSFLSFIILEVHEKMQSFRK